jgi:hypothetical protein
MVQPRLGESSICWLDESPTEMTTTKAEPQITLILLFTVSFANTCFKNHFQNAANENAKHRAKSSVYGYAKRTAVHETIIVNLTASNDLLQ